MFRGKYVELLNTAHRSGELCMTDADGVDDNRAFESLKASLQSHDWVVYTKAPFAGAANILAYLGRYSHKTAIANHRLVVFDGEQVRFRWRDYAHGNKRKVLIDSEETFSHWTRCLVVPTFGLCGREINALRAIQPRVAEVGIGLGE